MFNNSRDRFLKFFSSRVIVTNREGISLSIEIINTINPGAVIQTDSPCKIRQSELSTWSCRAISSFLTSSRVHFSSLTREMFTRHSRHSFASGGRAVSEGMQFWRRPSTDWRRVYRAGARGGLLSPRCIQPGTPSSPREGASGAGRTKRTTGLSGVLLMHARCLH